MFLWSASTWRMWLILTLEATRIQDLSARSIRRLSIRYHCMIECDESTEDSGATDRLEVASIAGRSRVTLLLLSCLRGCT